MLVIAIVFISLALLLYSIAIWSERIMKILRPWMIKTFFCAFGCDLIGTSLMFFLATGKLHFNLHSVSGYSALIIMGLHLVWAVIASGSHSQVAKIYFHRFSIFAWLIWLIAFTSGIPRA